tara:strand:+ start:10339 stop:11295 length:957 start_codon:yes stop_codon:yes gene_type:complete
MLDLTKEYRVEQRTNINDSSNLGREGLARHVGTLRTFSVSYNTLTKRYKTGLDIFDPELKKLDKKEYEEKIEWINKTKKSLEDQSGMNLDANNDDFWSVWKVDFEVAQNKRIKLMGSHPQFLPNLYWEHALALITLEANGELPKNRQEAGDPKFRDAQFFLTTDEEESTISKTNVKKTRQRAVEMSGLFENGEDKYERAFNIAYILGIQNEPVSIDKLEEVLEAFTPQPEYLDRFLALCKIDDTEIVLKVTIKKAIDYDIIKYRPEDRMHYRGGKNFRQTIEDTVTMFKTSMSEPDMAREFMEIKSEVMKKDAKKRKK